VPSTVVKSSAPYDHFVAGPYCRVICSANRRASGAGSCPTIRVRIVSPAGVKNVGRKASISAPDDHFAASPHCGVKVSVSRSISEAGGCPIVSGRIISSAGVKIAVAVISAPDDHFAASPGRRVAESGSGPVGGGGSYPTVSAGIISAASVESDRTADISTPHDHFTASPHCRVNCPCSGRARDAGGCPGICAGIVSAAGI
jgi:hypothetical protein